MIKFIKPLKDINGVSVMIRAPLYFWHQLASYTPVMIHLHPYFDNPNFIFSRDNFDPTGLERWGAKRTDPTHNKFFPEDYIGTVDAMISSLNYCLQGYSKRKDPKSYRQLVTMLPESYIYSQRIIITQSVVQKATRFGMYSEFSEWDDFLKWCKDYFYDILEGEDPMGYSVREIATMINVSDAGVRGWIKKGMLHRIENTEGYSTMGISAEELVRFFNANPKYAKKLYCCADLNAMGGNAIAHRFYALHESEITVLKDILWRM